MADYAFIGVGELTGSWNPATNSGSLNSGLTLERSGGLGDNIFAHSASAPRGTGGYHYSTNLTASTGDYWEVNNTADFTLDENTTFSNLDWVIWDGEKWVRISNSDKVGSVLVGNTSNQLEVITNDLDIEGGLDVNTNDGNNDFTVSAEGVENALWVDASTNYVIMGTGSTKVGIGTASPASQFHLNGSSGEVEFRIQSSNKYSTIVQKDNAELIIQNASNGPIIFYDDTAERMRIDNDGKVGIGDSSPDALLDLQGASATGVPTLLVDHDDADVVGIDINLANDTAIGIDIDASNTTAAVLDIVADALTTGTALNISTAATGDNAGSLVKIAQAGSRAGSAASIGLDIDFNTAANANARAFRIDSEQTTGIVAEINGDALTTGTGIDLSTDARTTGTALNISDSATNDNAGSLVKIAQAGSRAGSAASIGLDIDFNTVANANARAFRIDSEQTTGVVAEINGDAITTGKVIDISADALTTGAALYIDDNSSSTSTRSTVNIIQNNASATGTTALNVQADGNGLKPAINIDKNLTATTHTFGAYGLNIDYDVTGVAASGQLLIAAAIAIDYDQAASHVGQCDGYAVHATLDASTSGTQNLKGVYLDLEGADTHTGLYIDCPAGADDYHIKLVDDSDLGDFFGIQVDTHGATTLKTIDDDATAANLTFDVDGDITLKPAGLNILFNDGSNDVFDFDIADPTLKIMDDADTGDYFSINVGAAGATTITTVDDDGHAADLTFTIDGAIKIDGDGVEIENDSDSGAAALLIDNDDTDQIAIDIDAANIDADVIDIAADAVTTARVIDITADGLTTGTALYIDDNSSSTSSRATTFIRQKHASATGAVALNVQGDGNGALPALLVDRNFTGTTDIGDATTDPTGLLIDYDVTGIVASGQTAYHDCIAIKYNQNAPTMVGNVFGKGIDLDMTAGTSGVQGLTGMTINVAGADQNGGLAITAPAYAADQYHIRLRSADDTGDYFEIGVAAHGATTFHTKDDDGTAEDAPLTLDIQGKFICEAVIEAVFNDDGHDVDFRVESVDETHMIFVEGSSNRMSIGDSTDAPAATLELTNANDGGVPLLQLNSNDTDKIAVDVNADNIDANVFDITADAVTTAQVVNITADALTTGGALYIDDDSSNTGTRSTVSIIQNNAAATGATPLTVQGDGNGALPALLIDKNFTGTTAIGNNTTDPTGLLIDYDVTGIVASGQTAYHDCLAIKYNQDSPTMVGNVIAQGIDLDMTAGTSGLQYLTGMSISVAGADVNGGLYINAPAYAANQYHAKFVSTADTGDYCEIGVAAAGETTIKTVDDDGTAAHLNFVVDGDIILGPAGGDVLPDGDSTRNLGSASKRWANIHTNDLHLQNERGDWTIIEEENDLTIRNNKTNKMYRFKLEEIED
jgi:hypothetical protein